MKVVLHGGAIPHMSRASHRLQWTEEGVVAEGDLVGASNAVTLCMKNLGVVLRPAWQALLVGHAGCLIAELVQRLWAVGAVGETGRRPGRPRCTASQTTEPELKRKDLL